MLIQKLIDLSKNYIGGDDIKNVLITVPSYYNNSQREAIKNAGKACGVNTLRIVSEETAACYAYRLYKDKKKKNILVFNMRSNETNVTILNLQDNGFKVIKTVRDDNLGGNNFNEELIKYCINEFKGQTGIIIQKDSKSYKRLEKECENSIINLSQSSESQIELDNLEDGEDLNIYLFISEFEDMCKYLFDKIIPLISEVLENSSWEKNEIDEIILTGGSTRIQKIQEIIQQFFNGKEFNNRINPEEVYVIGTAVLAAIVIVDEDEDEDEDKVEDEDEVEDEDFE